MFFLKQVSYSSIRSFDPAVPVAGPPQTVSNLWNSTHHVFMHLHPGTTYQFLIRASTVKGFGPATAINVTTNISGMHMNKVQTRLIVLLVVIVCPEESHMCCVTHLAYCIFKIVMYD
jgi:hypothetical protein